MLRYRGYEYVPGIAISGRIANREGAIRVRGRIEGRVEFKPKVIVATIDGETVRQPR